MQTIDLRKKNAQPLPPEPPVRMPEPVKKELPPEPEPEIETPSPVQAEAVSWSAHFHNPISKPAASYIGALLFLGAAASVLLKQDLLFSAILVLLGIVLIMTSHAKPRPSQMQVDLTGVSLDDQKYLYHEISSFWLDYQPPHTKELSLQFKKVRQTPLRLPLGNTNPLEIRAVMIQFIPEKEHDKSLLDQLIHRLRS